MTPGSVPTRFPTRDDCPTCNEKRDAIGRLPIGFCGPDCLMAKEREQRLALKGRLAGAEYE